MSEDGRVLRQVPVDTRTVLDDLVEFITVAFNRMKDPDFLFLVLAFAVTLFLLAATETPRWDLIVLALGLLGLLWTAYKVFGTRAYGATRSRRQCFEEWHQLLRDTRALRGELEFWGRGDRILSRPGPAAKPSEVTAAGDTVVNLMGRAESIPLVGDPMPMFKAAREALRSLSRQVDAQGVEDDRPVSFSSGAEAAYAAALESVGEAFREVDAGHRCPLSLLPRWMRRSE